MAVFNLKNMPDDLHRALKIQAAIMGVSMHDLILRYCEEGLNRDKKEKKKEG